MFISYMWTICESEVKMVVLHFENSKDIIVNVNI